MPMPTEVINKVWAFRGRLRLVWRASLYSRILRRQEAKKDAAARRRCRCWRSHRVGQLLWLLHPRGPPSVAKCFFFVDPASTRSEVFRCDPFPSRTFRRSMCTMHLTAARWAFRLALLARQVRPQLRSCMPRRPTPSSLSSPRSLVPACPYLCRVRSCHRRSRPVGAE